MHIHTYIHTSPFDTVRQSPRSARASERAKQAIDRSIERTLQATRASEMRRHGWQLPYHPLQVIAVSVFLALVFAFYVFVIPFLEFDVLKFVVSAVYSSAVAVVTVLYVWCVGVNPADIGVLRISNCNGNHHSQSIDDMLYCSLCRVEISKDSKHCRVCDKCVVGFDHHCRWLNNCVGKRNYKGFVALMVSAIAMLIVQWSVGLWLVVHCFLRLSHFENLIASKLGTYFPAVAYIVILASCTILSMAATYPLCQLFFFHSILIMKGVSTYDYIIAMREQQDSKGVGDSVHSPAATSPISSIGTGTTGGSSIIGVHGRPWCTPPRLFVDDEEDAASESHMSVKDWNSSNLASNNRKKPVKLNPWNLAALNRDEVLRLSSIAKEKSSILRPVGSSNPKVDLEGIDMSRRPYSSRNGKQTVDEASHHDIIAVNEHGNCPEAMYSTVLDAGGMAASSNTSIMYPSTRSTRNPRLQVEYVNLDA